MAAVSERTHRLPALVLAALLLCFWPDTAHADDSCNGVPRLAISMADFRYAMTAASEDQLGLDVRVGALAVSFTDRPCRWRHSIELLDWQAPDYGDPDSRVYHFLGYRLAHLEESFSSYLGIRLLTLTGDGLSLVTPTAGVRVFDERMSFALQVELPGAFAVALGDQQRAWLDGLLLSAVATRRLTERTRLEVRATWRDYRGLGQPRDLMLVGGLGVAPAARGPMRGLPAFIGVGARQRSRRGSPDLDTQLLLLLEFDLGAVGD